MTPIHIIQCKFVDIKEKFMEYNIEFTMTVSVEAENEDEAISKAIKEIAPTGTTDIGNFYIYCNDDCYN